MELVTGALAVCCLALGVMHLLRLAVRRVDMIGEGSHAAMCIGMAAMFSPLPDPVPTPVWIVIFVACLGWFGAVAIRGRSLGGEPGHHVVGSAAMLFMLLSGHAGAAGHASGNAGHGGGVGGFTATSIIAIVAAGYFAWHGLRCADRLRMCHAQAEPVDTVQVRAGSDSVAALGGSVLALPAVTRPQTAAVAHIVMAVAMTVMLLGMV
ncbi:DUF5134 domain-containing protein [Pseudonocardia sp. GCM10023141]|uniref:DUF5134 domain-containing protein n=1 Tax=Pseudonocardia sp. GCM10023141 TaxID=3252653 RepID=UPI003615C8A4